MLPILIFALDQALAGAPCAPGETIIFGKQGVTCIAPPDPQSWDQANLKRDDSGCPTAIYVVDPKTGLLVQCP